MNEAKVAREARKLEAILKYTRYSLMPHGFTDEELYQIEEAVKLLVELNGVTRMEVLSISKKKGLKQADLKNFCWNIAKPGIKQIERKQSRGLRINSILVCNVPAEVL